MHALTSYLKLICEYELHSLPNTKVSGAKDHGKNCINVRPPLVRHLLRNRLSYFGHLFCDQYLTSYSNFFFVSDVTDDAIDLLVFWSIDYAKDGGPGAV